MSKDLELSDDLIESLICQKIFQDDSYRILMQLCLSSMIA
jgi:hypothetical protein